MCGALHRHFPFPLFFLSFPLSPSICFIQLPPPHTFHRPVTDRFNRTHTRCWQSILSLHKHSHTYIHIHTNQHIHHCMFVRDDDHGDYATPTTTTRAFGRCLATISGRHDHYHYRPRHRAFDPCPAPTPIPLTHFDHLLHLTPPHPIPPPSPRFAGFAACNANRRMKLLLSEFAVLMYTCAGLGITIHGQQAARHEAPVLVVSPHSSFLDAVIIYLTGLASPLVRNADRNLGKLIDYAQPIYVCREDPHSRQSTIREIIQRANSPEDWPQILIFPEGTCTNRTSLIQFKPGAFYPGVPIQPVLMRYPNKIDTVTWTWEGPDAIQLLWRTLTQFHTFCEIEFLPVYYPSEEEKADPKLYARNVRNLMARALDIPISDYTFDDCKLMTFVKNVHLPYAASSADIEKLRKTLCLDQRNPEMSIVRLEREFNDRNSYVTIEEFANRLQIDAEDESTVGLFRIFLKTSNGTVIDFREYLLLTLFLITLYTPKLQYVEALFQLYGVDGCVDRERLYDTLKYLVRISHADVDALFFASDAQNRGTINFEQFCAAIEQHPLQRKLQKNNDPNNLRLG
uniref:Putative phosphate acyltransferase n=1 Tax=Anopheles darlingi TaxID=43151 RepID=A0A2M4CGW1_ANODA